MKDGKFVLAHNGILYNDRLLRCSNGLPKTKIETDSYIAVQLIEQKKALDFSSLKYMAEQVEGIFSFTVLDEHENLYFVKGDNTSSVPYEGNRSHRSEERWDHPTIKESAVISPVTWNRCWESIYCRTLQSL
ncbi:hypothetical protein [Dysosmobacter sp. HCP28S3_G4]|uniref:hypothetical protein n=1 Tax=Dysosmobacter sp. HCP28S3_G4 TaxID=3438938 RepID=UPI003F8C9AC3